MSRGRVIPWASLERWGPKLFLASGVLILLAAANHGVVFFNEGYSPDVVSVSLLFVGYITTLAGVGSLYPRLNSDGSRLAQVSLLAVGGGIAIFVVMLVWAIANMGGLAPNPKPVIAVPALLLLLAGFVLFSITILRTDTYPAVIGLLLLAEVAALLVVFVGSNVLFGENVPDVFTVGMEVVQAVIILTIWSRLRAEIAPTGPARGAPESGA